MQHGANTTGARLQTCHGVVFNRMAITDVDGVIKSGEVTPNSLFDAGIFFLSLRCVKDEQTVNHRITIEVELRPIHFVFNSVDRFFCKDHGQKLSVLIGVFARTVRTVGSKRLRGPYDGRVYVESEGRCSS